MHPTLHPADKQSLRQVKTLAQIALTVLIEEGSKDSNPKDTLKELISTHTSICKSIENEVLPQMYVYWLNTNDKEIRVRQSVLEVCRAIGISSQDVPEASHNSTVDISQFITSYGPIQNLHLRPGTIAYLVHNNLMPAPRYRIHGFCDIHLTVLDLWNIPDKETIEHLLFTRNGLNHICICTGPLQELNSLKTLAIQDNNIPRIGPNTFCSLGNLTSLRLCRIGIKTIEPGAFNGLKRLVRLDLGFNAITTIEPGAFNGLDNLQKLFLSHNQIESLPHDLLSGLKNLENLFLLVNRLKFIAPGAFSRLNKLNSISLDLNPELKLPCPDNLAVLKAQHPEWF